MAESVKKLKEELEVCSQTKYASVMNLIHRCNELEKRLRGKNFTREELEEIKCLRAVLERILRAMDVCLSKLERI